jgi:hypothetical protein
MKPKLIISALLIVAFLSGCTPNNEPRGCNSFSNEKFSESNLIGTWGGTIESAWDSTITIREDGKYKQTLCIDRTGFKYESDWLPWRVTYSEKGLPYLHLQGLRMCAYWPQIDCGTGKTGLESVTISGTIDVYSAESGWYDYCQEKWVKTSGEGVFVVFGGDQRSERGIALVPLTKSAGGLSGPSYELRKSWSTNLIFADGFESGDMSVWATGSDGSSEVDGLQVSPAAALIGQYGLQVVANSATPRYVRDDTPDRESRYLARFFFHPNAVVMPNGNTLDIFAGYDNSGKSPSEVFRVQLRFLQESGYQVRGQALKGDLDYASTPWYPISDSRHSIRIYWATDVAINTQDGLFVLDIDGEPMWSGGFLDLGHNAQHIDEVRLGKPAGEGVVGTLYFDAFDSGHSMVDCIGW